MIPKIIHQIWVGNNPMPEHCLEFVEKIKEFNPEYEHKMWGNEVFDHYKDDEYLKSFIEHESSIPIAFTCDRIRLLLLKEFGGIYLDVDCKPIKSFNYILDKITESHCFFAGVKKTQNHNTLIDCAIYGSTPNSRVVNDCLDTYAEVTFANGGRVFSDVIIEKMGPDVALFNYEYFYNWEITENTVLLHDIVDTRLFSWIPINQRPK